MSLRRVAQLIAGYKALPATSGTKPPFTRDAVKVGFLRKQTYGVPEILFGNE